MWYKQALRALFQLHFGFQQIKQFYSKVAQFERSNNDRSYFNALKKMHFVFSKKKKKNKTR